MSKESPKYKLDKTIFQSMKVEEADNHAGYWRKKTLEERLDAACYLIHQFYGTTPHTPIDKSVFQNVSIPFKEKRSAGRFRDLDDIEQLTKQ